MEPRKYINTDFIFPQFHQSPHSNFLNSSKQSRTSSMRADCGRGSHFAQKRLYNRAIFHPNRGGYVLGQNKSHSGKTIQKSEAIVISTRKMIKIIQQLDRFWRSETRENLLTLFLLSIWVPLREGVPWNAFLPRLFR